MSHYSLAEAPSGLVHIINVYGAQQERATTNCGTDVDWERWTRIRMYDERMFSKGPREIARMVELPKCGRCFPDSGTASALASSEKRETKPTGYEGTHFLTLGVEVAGFLPEGHYTREMLRELTIRASKQPRREGAV